MTIPAAAVVPLRDGLRSQLTVAAQQITSADEQVDPRAHVADYQDALRHMDALRALLEEIGWSEPPSDQHVDPWTHGLVLSEALRDQIGVLIDMLRDGDRDAEPRETLARELNALTDLALSVPVIVQAPTFKALVELAVTLCAAITNSIAAMEDLGEGDAETLRAFLDGPT
ncbi:MAG: hypothetical protein ACRDK7_04295 [Solirubrobacteraceae bacterium]